MTGELHARANSNASGGIVQVELNRMPRHRSPTSSFGLTFAIFPNHGPRAHLRPHPIRHIHRAKTGLEHPPNLRSKPSGPQPSHPRLTNGLGVTKGPGGRRNPLIRLNSAKEIKGFSLLYFGRALLDVAPIWRGFGFGLESFNSRWKSFIARGPRGRRPAVDDGAAIAAASNRSGLPRRRAIASGRL